MKKLSIMLLFFTLPLFLLAATPSGQIVGWGANISGEATGVPSYSFSNGALQMTGNASATGAVTIADEVVSNIVSVVADDDHSLALCSDGTVLGFGGNPLGKSVGFTNPYPFRASGRVKLNGNVLSNVISVAVSHNFSLALKKDGTLATWGANDIPAGLSNIVAIAAEFGGNWILKMDGTVAGLGNSDYAQTRPAVLLSNIAAIAVGPGDNGTRGVALRKDGGVDWWGSQTIYSDASPPLGLTNVTAIAVGQNHSLALRQDGTVVGWGFNDFGQATGIPTTNTPAVSSGVVTMQGEVLSNVVSIAASRDYSMALKRDGTIVSWGRVTNNLYPIAVPIGLSNIVAIAAGANYCLAITTNPAVADKFRRK